MINMWLKYGKRKLELDLPGEIDFEKLELPEITTLKDPQKEVENALDAPIDFPALSEFVNPGESVCILVNDSTRVAKSEVFLPVLLEKLLEAGVYEKDIFLVFTNGAHRLMSKEEMTSLVGEEVAARVPMYNHDCKNDNMIYLGKTSFDTPVYINKRVYDADKRILTGSVVYHFFAGFGGGRKALVPGVSSHETIQANHSMMLSESAILGNIKTNPVHLDQVEGASMLGNNFLLNVILNDKKEFLNVFAGDMIAAHKKACDYVKEVYGVKINEPGDMVIASCGGYPKDINLYQAQKTLENALQGVKEGGQLILVAECSEGMGSSVFEEWISYYSSLEEVEKALEKNFILGGHKAHAIYKVLQKVNVLLVSSLEDEKSKQIGFIPAPSFEEAVNTAFEELPEKPLVYVMPEGSLAVPDIINKSND